MAATEDHSATPAMTVRCPVAGSALALSDVADPVFAGEYVGPGVAIEPDPVAGRSVIAPISGQVATIWPHAFVIRSGDRAVLVHLGIDTVELEGTGFTLHANTGDGVIQGQLMTTWDPAAVIAGGRAATCPVVALGTAGDRISVRVRSGSMVRPGDPLFTVA